MQHEQDEFNRVQDFDLDAWLDEVEPTQRVQTVNTRGDLLAKYGKAQEKRAELMHKVEQLAESLPDEDDDGNEVGGTLSSVSEPRAAFEDLKAQIEAATAEVVAISDEYASHKARVTFKVPDKSARARIASEARLTGHNDSLPKTDDTTLRLMHAAVVEISVVRGGREIPQDVKQWTLPRFRKFLDRIGDGQTRLLVDAYLGLAMGGVTPPFSQES